MSTPKGGPRTKAQKADARRREVQEELEEIALAAAPDALRLLARAFSNSANQGNQRGILPPTREQIQAATYILNQVIGRPTQKEAPIETDNAVNRVLNEIAALRKRRQPLAAQPGGTPDLVESDGL